MIISPKNKVKITLTVYGLFYLLIFLLLADLIIDGFFDGNVSQDFISIHNNVLLFHVYEALQKIFEPVLFTLLILSPVILCIEIFLKAKSHITSKKQLFFLNISRTILILVVICMIIAFIYLQFFWYFGGIGGGIFVH